MADTYTSNVAFACPALNQTGWNVEIVANYQLLDSLNPVGALAITLTEQPSATLNVKVAPGSIKTLAGAVVAFAGSSSQAVPANSTKVLYLDGTASWALAVAAGYPNTAHVRLGTVTAGASTITNIVDNRVAFAALGTLQNVGFFNATPVAQQTFGANTAGGTYTSNEQGMIQTMWNAFRTYGLGS